MQRIRTLDCIKQFAFRRHNGLHTTHVHVDIGSRVEIVHASNLPNNNTLYWVVSIDYNDEYQYDSYGILIDLTDEEIQDHFTLEDY